MEGDSGSNTTTVQKSDPWEGAIPYLNLGMKEARNLYNSPSSYYPNSTVAAQSPTTQAGTTALANRGMMGSPLVAGAQGQQAGTIAGQYLNSNPNMDSVYQNVAGKVLPSVNSQFSAAGRYGSNAHQNQQIDQLTTAFAPYASQNYQFERSNQEAASRNAPGLAAADYQDINAVLGAGQMQDAYGQRQVDADVARHDWSQNIGQQKLANYLAMIQGGTVGGTQTTTGGAPAAGGTNWAQLLGLGMQGLGTAGQIGWL